MALCASVMTGIYASPVMAAELYEYNNDSQWVTTKGDNGTKITELEGLESIISDSFATTPINGNSAFWVNKDGMMEAAYGKFAVDAEGVVTATNFKAGDYDLTTIGDKTQNMWADGSQTNFSHSVNVEGSFSSGNGAVNL